MRHGERKHYNHSELDCKKLIYNYFSVRSRHLTERAAALVATIAFALLAAAPALASTAKGAGSGDARAERVFTVTHASITTQLVTAGSDGHQLGDLRVLTATPIANAAGTVVGRLDAQLVTTTIDFPNPGDQVRMSTLNFVFGRNTNAQLAGSADQIIVSGSGFYPADQSALATGTVLVRPITGGSGSFAGASGWARSEHLTDGTWRHTFHLLPVPRR